MATTSGGTVKSDHTQMRRRGLWRSGVALMSWSGWNDNGWGGGKIEGQGGPVEKKKEDQRKFLGRKG